MESTTPATTTDTLTGYGWAEPWKHHQSEWQTSLEGIKGFTGKPKEAAIFLSLIAEGVKIAKTEVRRNHPSFVPPILLVEGGERSERMSVFHNITGDMDAIWVGMHYLATISRLEYGRIGTVHRPDGKAIFRGKVEDLGILIGVEETDHSRFEQINGKIQTNLNALDVSVAEYDALDHEFQALLLQRKIAVARKMPAETVSFLEKRIEAARLIRER